MTKLYRFLLKYICEKIVIQGYFHEKNIKEYYEIAKETAKFLKKQITKNGLIHWYDNNKKLEKPFLIAPAGSVFYILDKFELKFDDSILSKQNPDGSYPNALGYNDSRDKTPTLGWSQFIFLYLSTKVTKPLPKPKTKPFNIPEDKSKLKNYNLVKLTKGNSGYVFFRKDKIVSFSKKIKSSSFKIPKENGELQILVDNYIPKKVKVKKSQKIIKINLEKNNLLYKLKRLFNYH